jgi:hypothetical protein
MIRSPARRDRRENNLLVLDHAAPAKIDGRREQDGDDDRAHRGAIRPSGQEADGTLRRIDLHVKKWRSPMSAGAKEARRAERHLNPAGSTLTPTSSGEISRLACRVRRP